METQIPFQSAPYEQTVINIIRKLPPDRVLQLVDFAHFLEFQINPKNYIDNLDKELTETPEDIEADEEKWDALFARPEAQKLLNEMAQEALEDYRANRTTDITTTEDGRLKPA